MSPRTEGFSLINGPTGTPPILYLSNLWTPEVVTQLSQGVPVEPSPPLFHIGQAAQQSKSKARRKQRTSGRAGRTSPTASCSIVGQTVTFSSSASKSGYSDQTTDSEAEPVNPQPSNDTETAPKGLIKVETEKQGQINEDTDLSIDAAVSQPLEATSPTWFVPAKASVSKGVGPTISQLYKDVRDVIAQPPLWGLVPPKALSVDTSRPSKCIESKEPQSFNCTNSKDSLPSECAKSKNSQPYECTKSKNSQPSEYTKSKETQTSECTKSKNTQPLAPFIWMIPSVTQTSFRCRSDSSHSQPVKKCLPSDSPPSYESTFPSSAPNTVRLNHDMSTSSPLTTNKKLPSTSFPYNPNYPLPSSSFPLTFNQPPFLSSSIPFSTRSPLLFNNSGLATNKPTVNSSDCFFGTSTPQAADISFNFNPFISQTNVNPSFSNAVNNDFKFRPKVSASRETFSNFKFPNKAPSLPINVPDLNGGAFAAPRFSFNPNIFTSVTASQPLVSTPSCPTLNKTASTSTRCLLKPKHFSSIKKVSFNDKQSINDPSTNVNPATSLTDLDVNMVEDCFSFHPKVSAKSWNPAAFPGASVAPTTTVNSKSTLTLNTSMFVMPKVPKAGFSLGMSPSGRRAMYRTGQPRGKKPVPTRPVAQTPAEPATNGTPNQAIVVRIENVTSPMQQLDLGVSFTSTSSQPCLRINTDNLMIQITSDTVKVVINPGMETSTQLKIQ